MTLTHPTQNADAVVIASDAIIIANGALIDSLFSGETTGTRVDVPHNRGFEKNHS
jgi:hypothetical protein